MCRTPAARAPATALRANASMSGANGNNRNRVSTPEKARSSEAESLKSPSTPTEGLLLMMAKSAPISPNRLTGGLPMVRLAAVTGMRFMLTLRSIK